MTIRDRILILAKLERLRSLKVRRVYFGTKGPPPPDGAIYQPIARFNFMLSGRRCATLPLAGKATQLILKAGDVQVSAQDSWEKATFDRPHELLCIVPRTDYLRVALHAYEVGRDGAIVAHAADYHTPHGYSPAIRHTARALCTCAEHTAPGAAHALAQALKHLAIAELTAADEHRKSGAAAATYTRIRRWIENNFQQRDIGRDTAAKTFGLTPNHVSRLFRQQSGGTFIDCLTRQRIAFSETLLAQTELKVYQVASQCGFQSSAYFVKRFHELHGMTPVEYRTRMHAGHRAGGQEPFART